MVERQPRHQSEAGRRNPALVHKEVSRDLLEIGKDISVRDHDTGRRTGGARRVLQIQEIRPVVTGGARSRPGGSRARV